MTGRRPPATCSAVNCPNRAKKGSGIMFHPFPLNNEDLLKKWLIAMRRAKFTPTKSHFLCSTHFEDKCYSVANNGRRILHSRATPSKFNFPERRPIRISTGNSTTNSPGLSRTGDGPPIHVAQPIVISPPQQQVNPVRRAFLKDHCYSLPGLQKLKKSLDESESSSVTRSRSIVLSEAEQILGTALQERRLVLSGLENATPEPTTITEVVEVPQSNPIQEHIDACVMKAVTPLEQQLLHMQEVVAALKTQITQQRDTSQQSRNRRAQDTSENRKESFDWASLLPVQPSGWTLPTDEIEIQRMATRLAVNFSDIPAEAIAEQYQVHYVLTQFAAWPSLPPAQKLATYRTAKMLFEAISNGWVSAIQMEQEQQVLSAQNSTSSVVRVPVQVGSYTTAKRSSPRGGGGLVARVRRAR